MKPLLYGLFTAALALAACTPPPQDQHATAAQATLQAYVDAWNRHDSLAFDTLLAPTGVHEDLAWRFRGEGPAAVRAFLRDVIAVSPDFRWEITRSFADGQDIAAEWTWTATYTGPSPIGPVTNRPISGRGAAIVRIEDGKIARFTDYYDVASFFPPQTQDTVRK
jgi:steroid delta-isomerase-like uncharacterized protein